ncbi:MAG: zinc-dependent alcohol dehydrogenase family protein [Candidatus Marinimicrobia bacterium]|nr:zinc-dependent alcohol dehydrogenase family protein [Candidatus Neomarinimicrobiota bacterium]
MRAALFDGTEIKLIQKTTRKIRTDEVLLKVSVCGICGTDIKILAGKSHTSPPVILGHEFCGVIEECGKNISTLSEGNFVSVNPNIYCGYCQFCRKGEINLCENLIALGVDIDGGFAEYCVVPAKQCYKLPAEIPLVNAALLEPLSCALYGNKIAKIISGDSVLIIGSGMIGIIMVMLAKLSGAARVIVIDKNEKRLCYAKNSGADYVFANSDKNMEESITDILNDGADIVIECVGSVATCELAIRLVKNGGKVIIFGVTPVNQKMTISPYEIYKRDLSIRGSFLNPHTFFSAVELIASKKLNFEGLDIAKFPLGEINNAIENQRKSVSLKTIIDMSL